MSSTRGPRSAAGKLKSDARSSMTQLPDDSKETIVNSYLAHGNGLLWLGRYVCIEFTIPPLSCTSSAILRVFVRLLVDSSTFQLMD